MPRQKLNWLVLVAASIWCGGALAQGSDPSRGVQILGPEPPATPQQTPLPTVRLDQKSLAAENSAGLSLEVLPATELDIGTKIYFRVAAKRSGYLILVDVDAAGKLTQIFPNSAALLVPEGLRESFNRVQPGTPVRIPDAGSAFGGFEFIVSEPRGVAMTVAILSNQPVQLMDLPDVPTPLTGRADALKYLTDVAKTLRIVRANTSGRAEEPKLSFDAKFYIVR